MSDDLRALVDDLRLEVRALTALLAAEQLHRQTPRDRRLRLEDCGDVVTLAELGQLLGFGPRYCERLVTLERRTGVRVLPPSVAGTRGRYLRRDVEQWLRRGIVARRVEKPAGRADDTGRP